MSSASLFYRFFSLQKHLHRQTSSFGALCVQPPGRVHQLASPTAAAVTPAAAEPTCGQHCASSGKCPALASSPQRYPFDCCPGHPHSPGRPPSRPRISTVRFSISACGKPPYSGLNPCVAALSVQAAPTNVKIISKD